MEADSRTSRIFASTAFQGMSRRLELARDAAVFSGVATRAALGDLTAAKSESERIMSSHARTFRFATRFLPTEYRETTMELYAFFRTLDDLVDESGSDPVTISLVEQEIAAWELWLRDGMQRGAPRYEIGRSTARISRRYAIPIELFQDFLAGMRADLAPQSPLNREEVEQYSYQVASTVGIAMAHVFGTTDKPALEAATRLGLAMQLTNILRDIGSDVSLGRNYLPCDLLARHGLTPADVADMRKRGTGPDARLVLVIQEMTSWADKHYRAGIDGIQLLPRDVRLPIMIAARLYQQILRQLEANEYDSLRHRVATGKWQKLHEAYRCAVQPNPVAGVQP